MLLQVATKIFQSNSVGGDARSSVANEACHWCRSVFLLRAVGVLAARRVHLWCWLVHVSQSVQNFVALTHLNGILLHY